MASAIFLSVVAFCILLYKLQQLRNEHEVRMLHEKHELQQTTIHDGPKFN